MSDRQPERRGGALHLPTHSFGAVQNVQRAGEDHAEEWRSHCGGRDGDRDSLTTVRAQQILFCHSPQPRVAFILLCFSSILYIISSDFCLSGAMTVANGVIQTPVFGRFSVEKQESLLKISILSIAAVLAFSTRLFSVLRLVTGDIVLQNFNDSLQV